MKKQRRMLLSLLCALTLLFQLALPVASAERTSSVSGDETLIAEIRVPAPETLDDLLADEEYAIRLGEVDLTQDPGDGMQMKDLLATDLTVTAPSGYRIAGLYLRGADTEAAGKSLLPDDAGANPTTVTLGKDSFQKGDGSFQENVLSSYADAEDPVYALAVYFTAIDDAAAFTVSHDLNGVAGELADESGSFGSTFTVPDLSEQQKSDARDAQKLFSGWVLRYADGSHMKVSPGDVIAPHADCTLEARWRSFCIVSFDTNGGSEVEAQTVNDGGTAAEPADPNRDGYSFAGWFSDEALSNPYDFSSAVTGNITLYAKWNTATRASHTVSFASNGGSEVEAQSVNDGGTATEPADPSRDGCSFAGWFSDEALSTPYDFSSAVTGDITLYAKWTENAPTTHTVSFVSNGGSAVDAQTVSDGGTATEPANPSRDGFSFAGWFSDEALSTPYDFSSAVTGDITLYAKWNENAPITHTVSFASNGGSAVDAQTVSDGGTATEPANPSRDGYSFAGWFSDEALSNPYDFSSAVTGDITLYAKWNEDEDEPLTPTIVNLSIEAVTAEKVYDGTPLKAAEYNENDYTNGYKLSGLVEGHKLEGISVSGEALTPGAAVPVTIDTSKLKITDADGKDVTDSYQVKTTDGKLTIQARSLVLTAISDSQEYSGQTIKASELNKEGFEDGYSIGGDGLVSGHTLSAITVSGEGKDAGSYATHIEDPDDITVSNGNEDVTACYSISTADGSLEITRRTITITAISGTVTETGNTIYAKNYSGNGFIHGYKSEGLLDGHTLQGDFVTGSGVEASFDTGIDANKVQILDEKNNDVTKNYAIKTVGGRMKVKGIESTQTGITVTASAKKVYDATPLTIKNSDIKVTQGTLPANYTLEASFGPTTSITDVQKISVNLSNVKVKDGSGKDVTSQFKITTVSGTLEVTKKPLTLTAESDSKTYDGKALINKNVRATALASKNHVLNVEYEITNSDGKVIKTGAVNVGTYTKKITGVTIKEGNRDVTSNYNITTVDGKLTITAGSTKKNDGVKPKTGDENNLNLWLGVVIVSAALVLTILLVLKLHTKKKKAAKPKAPRKKE